MMPVEQILAQVFIAMSPFLFSRVSEQFTSVKLISDRPIDESKQQIDGRYYRSFAVG